MKTLGNFIWFIFCGGAITALAWFILGAVMAGTIVGLPFAYAAFRIGQFAAFPFGKELIDVRLLGKKRLPGTLLANIVWFVVAGVWLAVCHVASAMYCLAACIFIIPIFFGAPAWAVAHLTLAGASLAPLGKQVVSSAVAAEAKRLHLSESIAQLRGE